MVTLDKGQRKFYDYSRIVRQTNFPAPSRKLLIVYDRYDVPSNDTGSFYTVASYDAERFSKDVPHLKNGLRASDTIDFRPRVANFSGSGSPFAFPNRTFNSPTNPPNIVTPNESSIIGYGFYLPRVDKVVLDADAMMAVMVGESSIKPVPPSTLDNTMELGTINLPLIFIS